MFAGQSDRKLPVMLLTLILVLSQVLINSYVREQMIFSKSRAQERRRCSHWMEGKA